MVAQKVTVKNTGGFHLRPASVFCKKALEFDSLITFRIRNTIANAKSVLSVLAAGVKENDEIELICEGNDEKEALSHMIALIESGLGEEHGSNK